MAFLETLFKNHPFANISFVVVLLMGAYSYSQMPRERDPEINFNFVAIVTLVPGATSTDIENKVTAPLEDALRQVADVKFVSSSSRQSISNILVRFEEMSESSFDKRIVDLRREIQNKAANELPEEAEEPQVIEVTTSNGFPTAMMLIIGEDNDETLRYHSSSIKTDIEGIQGVDSIISTGLSKPVLKVEFDSVELSRRGLRASDVADTVTLWFRDTVAGKKTVANDNWLVRIEGTQSDPSFLANIPLQTANPVADGVISLADVAEVSRERDSAGDLASFNGKPAVMLSINKKGYTNTLTLIQRINEYIDEKNSVLRNDGIQLLLIDDQTIATKTAIDVMQNNAWLGLFLVILICGFFLGPRISVMVGLGIPFSLAATFCLLHALGMTLNVAVLLAIVIALGMLVDDSVVVVETIYYRTQRGDTALQGSLAALKEVALPITTSVLTTVAAFLPLMLLPGIVGKFMFVIPFVVTVALLLSLLEAFWMLPCHLVWLEERFGRSRGFDSAKGNARWRDRFTKRVRLSYSRALVWAMRKSVVVLSFFVFLMVLAIGTIAFDLVKVQFFAFDPLRIFYVQIDMPAGATIEHSLSQAEKVAVKVNQHLLEGESRAVTATAGAKFTSDEPVYGDQYAQVVVSLNPDVEGMRNVNEIIDSMRVDVEALFKGDQNRGQVNFVAVEGGPPTALPIKVRVLGDDYDAIRRATDDVLAIVKKIEGTKDVVDDDAKGRPQLTLTLDRDAIRQFQLSPEIVARLVRLNIDGEVVASIRDKGEKVEVIVKAKPNSIDDVSQLLDIPVALPSGGITTLGNLVKYRAEEGKGVIKHYKFRRAITIEADLEKEVIDTLAANAQLKKEWDKIKSNHSSVTLDFSGEWDDVQESLSGMFALFLLGVGVMYLILATQFRSYSQPVIVLVTIPMAFIGVTFGLFVTNNPLSMFTMYGVVALTGIAVNSAIVLMDAANKRFAQGMSALHSCVYAAQRRIIPIIITSTTTIAGLFSLAAGIGGKSMTWGPMATSIVSGMAFATTLTVFVVPILIWLSMKRTERLALKRLDVSLSTTN